MDPMDSGMRYTPKSQDKDWDSSVQFLPATDSRKLEKKKGPGKVGAIIGLVIFAAVIALMTGLLVWHFHFRKDMKIKKMYSGSLKITNQAFMEAYEDSNSTEFRALAAQTVSQLKDIYAKIPQLSKYYIGSTVQAFSEGSVIAYYLSEFNVPAAQEFAVDSAMGTLDKSVINQARSLERKPLQFSSMEAAAVDTRMFRRRLRTLYRYAYHISGDAVQTLESPGFPDFPYGSNTLGQWAIRADPGYVVKLEFDTFNLEEDCSKDFVKVYDSLLPIESYLMAEECGNYPPNEPLIFTSSRNVMLVTLVTDDSNNFPGFLAHFSQIIASKSKECGGKKTGMKGTLTSPNYPAYYPPRVTCKWTIEVPEGKRVKLTLDELLMVEPDQGSGTCEKDYVQIDEKKYCGEERSITVTSKSERMTIVLHSDRSFVDHGFSAEYEAINPSDPCPGKFQCSNTRCIKSVLECDGWNDCGDNSDERNCKCTESQIKCKNTLCKPRFWQCDGVDDCGDNTDEQGCGCNKGEISCRNGQCVSEKKKCDGRDDCGDGTDESDCPFRADVTCSDYTFRCNNGKCISKLNCECDGVDDCEDNSDEANCDCGKQPYKGQRIVGGQNAEEGEWPWQVSLHIKNSGHVCGASLINDRWLVTAAHCVQDSAKVKYSQPGVWEAYLGLHKQGLMGKFTVKRDIAQVICHPYYNSYTFDNDIALMELSSPVTFSQRIKPICLPSATHDFPAGKNVWITGWGATREGGYGASVLQKAEVRIINGTICNNLMGGQITSRMMCAGVLSGGVDACQGDSGGPLSAKEISSRRMFLAGVVSWGDGCARRNKPGIYTRVTKFRSWIKEKTGV
ncbi:hypothetical protein SKAU_G00086970 [Synaphobranchus kaupii]|uniref:Suppressor of tumorigenicity 14 protein homolog n=1 Tax=Synaphobranchus kaupii TaxID=118154 RepID=A0A9Q1FWG5_SYNKA|nr:hypothetical protein SKAU_G00086970 [Synaphobranchus kaupii]